MKKFIVLALVLLMMSNNALADSIYAVSFEDAQRICFQTGVLRQSFTSWEESDWNDAYYPDAYYKRTLNDNLITPGWNTWNGKWRYFDIVGIKWLTGWQNISNEIYYFYQNGDMAANAYIDTSECEGIYDDEIQYIK